MAFCTRCGSNIPDGENFCPNCGAPVTPAGAPYQQAYVNPSDHTAEFAPEDIARNKNLAALSYLCLCRRQSSRESEQLTQRCKEVRTHKEPLPD